MSFITACGVKGTDNTQQTDIDLKVEKTAQTIHYWISQQYLNCLENNLPCDCLEGIEYTLITFNPDVADKIQIFEPGLNGEELEVKQGDHGFNVYTHINAPTPFFSFSISEDTMKFSKDGLILKYLKYTKYNIEQKEIRLLGKLNIAMLKNLLNTDDFDIDKDLNIVTETMFHCNVELGYINLLYNKGDCDNKWIIEQANGKILIYKYTNSCAAKTYPVFIDKELIYTILIKSRKTK